MTGDMNESNETPAQRVECLAVDDLRSAMVAVVASILERKDTRGVPDVLNRFGLLSRFDVYDCDHAWDALEGFVPATVGRRDRWGNIG